MRTNSSFFFTVNHSVNNSLEHFEDLKFVRVVFQLYIFLYYLELNKWQLTVCASHLASCSWTSIYRPMAHMFWMGFHIDFIFVLESVIFLLQANAICLLVPISRLFRPGVYIYSDPFLLFECTTRVHKLFSDL